MRPVRGAGLLAAVILSLPAATRGASAFWSCDPQSNVAICTRAGSQYLPVIASDGAGGAIVAWEDFASGAADVYAQHIDAAGTPLWTADGVPVCTAPGDQRELAITPDGAGGAILCWRDTRGGGSFLCAQHLDASGAPLWDTDGIRICGGGFGQTNPVATSDGAGGAIIAWQDGRNSDADLYAQRIDGAGRAQWQADGVPVCTAPGWQLSGAIAPDGAGGAFFTWHNRQDEGTRHRVHAQRIRASGEIAWNTDGIPLSGAPNGQYNPCIAADGAGGAIVAWQDSRSGVTDEYGQETYDIYSQRLSGAGVPLWAVDGVALCTQPSRQVFPRLVSDEAGGAVVCWEDERGHNGWSGDIYAQHVDAEGTVRWAENGLGLCTNSANQYAPAIVTDGSGGAIVSWFDGRTALNGFDVYAQRVDARGEPRWMADGEPLCAAPGDQYGPVITSDGAGGAILAWYDGRSGTGYDIYAAHAPQIPCGVPDPVEISLVSVEATPLRVRLEWLLSEPGSEPVEIQRRTEDGAWTVRASLSPALDSRLVFVDADVIPGARYAYRPVQWRSDVERTFGETWVEIPAILPLALAGARPNPARHGTSVVYSLPRETAIRLAIYDPGGRLVRDLGRGRAAAGEHAARWDERDDAGQRVSSGLYLVRLEAEGRVLISRIVVTR